MHMDAVEYAKTLKPLVSFDTLEGFARAYKWLRRPYELQNDCDLYMFRGRILPMWESFPEGGAWIVRIDRSAGKLLAKWWEALLFAAVTEYFEPQDVAGVVLSIRRTHATLCVWSPASVRLVVGERIRALFHLPDLAPLEFKTSHESIEDASTYHHFQH